MPDPELDQLFADNDPELEKLFADNDPELDKLFSDPVVQPKPVQPPAPVTAQPSPGPNPEELKAKLKTYFAQQDEQKRIDQDERERQNKILAAQETAKQAEFQANNPNPNPSDLLFWPTAMHRASTAAFGLAVGKPAQKIAQGTEWLSAQGKDIPAMGYVSKVPEIAVKGVGKAAENIGAAVSLLGYPAKWLTEHALVPLLPKTQQKRYGKQLPLVAQDFLNPLPMGIKGVLRLGKYGEAVRTAGIKALPNAAAISPEMQIAAKKAQGIVRETIEDTVRTLKLEKEGLQGAARSKDIEKALAKEQQALESATAKKAAAEQYRESAKAVLPTAQEQAGKAIEEVGKAKAAAAQVKQGISQRAKDLDAAQRKIVSLDEKAQYLRDSIAANSGTPVELIPVYRRAERLNEFLKLERERVALEEQLKQAVATPGLGGVGIIQPRLNEIIARQKQLVPGKKKVADIAKQAIKADATIQGMEEFYAKQVARDQALLDRVVQKQSSAQNAAIELYPRPIPGDNFAGELLAKAKALPEAQQAAAAAKGQAAKIAGAEQRFGAMEQTAAERIAGHAENVRLFEDQLAAARVSEARLAVVEQDLTSAQNVLEYQHHMGRIDKLAKEVGLSGDQLYTRLRTGRGEPGLATTLGEQLASKERYLVTLSLPASERLARIWRPLGTELNISGAKIAPAFTAVENGLRLAGKGLDATSGVRRFLQRTNELFNLARGPEQTSTMAYLTQTADLAPEAYRNLVLQRLGDLDGLVKKSGLTPYDNTLAHELAYAIKTKDPLAKSIIDGHLAEMAPEKIAVIETVASELGSIAALMQMQGAKNVLGKIKKKLTPGPSEGMTAKEATRQLMAAMEENAPDQIKMFQDAGKTPVDAVTGVPVKPSVVGKAYTMTPQEAMATMLSQQTRVMSRKQFIKSVDNLFTNTMPTEAIPAGWVRHKDFGPNKILPKAIALQYDRSKVFFEDPFKLVAPKAWEGFWTELKGINSIWKAGNTLGFLALPGYESANVISNKMLRMQNGLLFHNINNAKNAAMAYVPGLSGGSVWGKLDIEKLKSVPFYNSEGQAISTWGDMLELAGKYKLGGKNSLEDILPAGQSTVQTFLMGTPKKANIVQKGVELWQQGGKKIAGNVEDFDKTLAFMAQLEKGVEPQLAALMAQKALFDYAHVSPAVNFIRGLPLFGTPFVTFLSKNLPMQMELALKYPRQFYVLTKMVDMINRGVIDPEVENRFVGDMLAQGGVKISHKKDKNGVPTTYVVAGGRFIPAETLREWRNAYLDGSIFGSRGPIQSQMGPGMKGMLKFFPSGAAEDLDKQTDDDGMFDSVFGDWIANSKLKFLLKQIETSVRGGQGDYAEFLAKFVGLGTQAFNQKDKIEYLNKINTLIRNKQYKIDKDLKEDMANHLRPRDNQGLKNEILRLKALRRKAQALNGPQR